MNNARFGQIRSMLHSEPPSEALWKRLTGLLWGWRNNLPQEMMAEYCNALLESWPDELRELPRSWRRAVLRGEQSPIFEICRSAKLANRHLSVEDLGMLASCTTLGKITVLDLSNNDFSSYDASRTAWVEELIDAPILCSLRRLVLRSSNIDRETLAALPELDLRGVRELDLSWNRSLTTLPNWLAHDMSPTMLDLLGLQFAVDEQRSYDETAHKSSRQKERLNIAGLCYVLSTGTVRGLDLVHCKFAPTKLAEDDALEHLRTLICSPNSEQEEWTTLWREARLTNLRHLRLTSMSYSPGEGQIEALRTSIETGRLAIEKLDLPSYVMNSMSFRKREVPFFEAHGIALTAIDPLDYKW